MSASWDKDNRTSIAHHTCRSQMISIVRDFIWFHQNLIIMSEKRFTRTRNSWPPPPLPPSTAIKVAAWHTTSSSFPLLRYVLSQERRKTPLLFYTSSFFVDTLFTTSFYSENIAAKNIFFYFSSSSYCALPPQPRSPFLVFVSSNSQRL